MAEAHQAVAFQFRVTDEGISVHFDKTAVKASLRAIYSSTFKTYLRFRAAVLKGVFPASPISLVVLGLAVLALYYGLGVDTTCGLLGLLTTWTSFIGYSPNYLTILVLLFQIFILWVMLSYAQRFALKFLLMYKGWMFDSRGTRSFKTKLWSICVKIVTGPFKPQLLSYQGSLPRLPVPPLADTCRRYLESVQPLLEPDKFEERKKLVEDFKTGPGKRMQRYLVLKSWWASNYVTDWWEQYVYLFGRSSIMINSNYYACDVMQKPRCTQTARAGLACYTLMQLKKDIETERLKPLVIMDLIPLCSAQYDRLFGTTRIPGQEADKLVHFGGAESRYVVVYSKGCWYRVNLYHKNRLLEACEIERMIQYIVDDESEPDPGEAHLAALTSQDRKIWAETREQYFSQGVNQVSMECVEKAAFVMVLDEGRPEMVDGNGTEDNLTSYCRSLLHGNGYSRWFDKSFTFVIFANARLGINAEHSWADAPVIGISLEHCCNMELKIGYDDDGHCHNTAGTSFPTPPRPQKLQWDIPPPAISRIESALTTAKEKIADLDLFVLRHISFGKGDIKKCKMSPDAFIQMALQLAYYKDAGNKFCLTYEASMTRLYLEGRTETVRPVSMESTAFVRAMCDPKSSEDERRALLRVAVERHTVAYKKAMVGQGIDRHLFCLYVMSRYLKISSPFLDKMLGEPWRLSTSQTPTQQTGRLDYNKCSGLIAPGGGFGPVTKDGYGVSYIIPGDFVIFFHVSSFNSSPDTNSRRFADHIKDSMRDMRALFIHGSGD